MPAKHHVFKRNKKLLDFLVVILFSLVVINCSQDINADYPYGNYRLANAKCYSPKGTYMDNYEFVYDKSKLDKILDYQYPDKPDPSLLTIKFGYDPKDRLSSYSASHNKYPAGNWSRSFSYDDNDRVTAIESYYSLNVTLQQSNYVYNENNQLISYTNGGFNNTLEWDKGKIIRHTQSTGNMTYSYDESDRLEQRSDSLYRWVYSYKGNNNRVNRINVYVGGNLAYYWDFTWELGKTSFSMCDVEDYKKYFISFGWF